MGILDNLDQEAVFSDGGRFFHEGRYIVEINRCDLKQGYKGTNFVVEATVKGAISELDIAPKAGATAAHVWNADGDKASMARSTWIKFLCAMFDVEQSDYNGDQWKEISNKVLEGNALSGKLSYLEVYGIKTKANKDFTKHIWKGEPTPAQLSEFGLAA